MQAEISREDALAMVQPSATLTALERVGIYRDMYLARLSEALESDYPGLLHYLGKDGFESWWRAMWRLTRPAAIR